MRWSLVLGVSIGISGGCTRYNPGFGLTDTGTMASTSSSDDGGTTEPGDDSGDTSPDVTTGPDPGSTGADGTTTDDPGCIPEPLEFAPLRDTFLVLTEAELCEGVPCASANFGAMPVFPVRNQPMGFRSHLLMTFELDGLDIDIEAGADLVLFVGEAPDGFQLSVRSVYPLDWSEGEGLGEGAASPNESSWEYASEPIRWVNTRDDQQGTFEVLLDNGGMAIPTAEFGPFVDPQNEVVLPIPPVALLNALEGNGRLELDVTQFTNLFDVAVFAKESGPFSPLLALNAC